MRLTIKHRFLRWILRRILRKRAPDTIPRSGEKGRKADCFSIVLEQEGIPWVLADSVETLHLVGRTWSGASFSEQITVPWSRVNESDIRITHFYHLWDIKFSSITDYIRIHSTGYYRVLVWFRVSRQYIYNNIRITRLDRMEILRFVVEGRIEDSSAKFSEFDLVNQFHTARIWDHPAGGRTRRYYGLVLDSLATSGELEKPQSHEYIVSPKALTTLAEYELEERRHKDAQKTQRRIVYLTIMVVITALIQAYGTYLDHSGELREEPKAQWTQE